jgi:hypothetical protein
MSNLNEKVRRRQDRRWPGKQKSALLKAYVDNPMNIHRIECAESAVNDGIRISVQVSYNAKSAVFLRVNATVNH